MTTPADWRPLAAALANDRARQAYAGLVLGHSPDDVLADLPPSRRTHIVDSLLAAGLLVSDGDTLRTDDDVFRRLLAAAPRPQRPRGVERFLDGSGRITSYPSGAAERAELLALIAGRALAAGEVLSEKELNERLEPFSSDVAVLRRHLVDHGLVERTRSGSEYALTATPDR
jgi:hypothetical protein